MTPPRTEVTGALGRHRRVLLEQARLYVCVDAREAPGALRDLLEACCEGGVDVLQLRDKTAHGRRLHSAAAVFRDVCARHGVLFVLNDLPGLAVEVGADGVHVGRTDVPPRHAREVVGPDRVVGTSTHSVTQVDTAVAEDVDYLAVGPVHATPTKQGRPPTGLEPVRHAAETVERPWFAIGGLSRDTLPEVAAAGARRAVVVRAVVEARDPAAAARELRALLADAAD